MDYVVEVILEVWKRRERIQGLELTYEAPFLRHFTAHLSPLSTTATESRQERG
jgi:tryptophanase